MVGEGLAPPAVHGFATPSFIPSSLVREGFRLASETQSARDKHSGVAYYSFF